MQLQNTDNGPELEMNSALAYPSWTTSTKPCPCNIPYGKHNHWCPPDAFHCTFCPRVFRTAQALGGHMNIHRRERACANENGACLHTRLGEYQAINSMLGFRPSNLPASLVVGPHGSSLFGGSSSQLPIDLSQSSPSVRNFVENCYANRNIATALDAPRHPTANFIAPVADRVGRNRGDGATSTDPLSWLFSQLPPPGSVTALQRQQQLQQQQHQHQQYRATNGLFQNNLARPYARPSAPYADDTPQAARVKPKPVVAMGDRHGEQDGAMEGLDLELRL